MTWPVHLRSPSGTTYHVEVKVGEVILLSKVGGVAGIHKDKELAIKDREKLRGLLLQAADMDDRRKNLTDLITDAACDMGFPRDRAADLWDHVWATLGGAK